MKKIVFCLFIWGCLFPFQSVFATDTPDATSYSVQSRAHIQDIGDFPLDGSWVESPNRIGTVGQGKRIEGFEIKPNDPLPDGIAIRYNVHVQNIGWLYAENEVSTWAKDGDFAGTRGQGLRIEAIKVVLTDASGNSVNGYHIKYRGHIQDIGDTPSDKNQWIQDGEQLGTVGSSLRLEALTLEITKDTSPGTDLSAYNALLKVIESLKEADYTKTSWDNLQSTLEKNKVTAENSKAEVTATMKLIQTAVDNLENLTLSKIYDQAGTYGPQSGTETITQDVIIAANGITLQNLTVNGNLIIDEAVGDGNVTLNNVTVTGETRVRGGGQNSIHINGGQYQKILVEQTPTGAVRIVATGIDGTAVILSENAAGETLILEGSFDSISVQAPNAIIATQGQTNINSFNLSESATNANVNLGSSTTVANLAVKATATVNGTGTVKKAEVDADNVIFEKAPENYTVDPGVNVPPTIPTPQPSGEGSSGGGGYTPSKIALTVTDPTVSLIKTYDGSTATDVTNQTLDAAAVTGLVAGDAVTVTATATYDSKNVGTNKNITITYSLSGSDASKYNTPAKSTINSGEISTANLTLPTAAVTKTYDGTTTATQTVIPSSGKIDGDSLIITETATFNDASVGTGKSGTCTYVLTGTDAGNYNTPASQNFSSGEIIKKKVTITGTTVEPTKTYNGNDVATVNSPGTSTDFISGDTVSIEASAYYDDKNAGPRSIYVTYQLTGSTAVNYAINYNQPQALSTHPGVTFTKLTANGTINKVQLTTNQVPTVSDKTYDSTTATDVHNQSINNNNISGMISGDTVSLTATATFNNADAGNNKPVNIIYQLNSGEENYLPPVNAAMTATIIPLILNTKLQNVTASKEYDGTSKATVTGALDLTDTTIRAFVLNALNNGKITFTSSAVYKNSNGTETSALGSGLTIAYSMTLSGPNSGNYQLKDLTNNVINETTINGTTNNGSITPKTLTVTDDGLGLQTEKTYDGTTTTNVTGKIITAENGLTGIVSQENVTVTATGVYTHADVGDQAITVTYTLDGTNKTNYRIENKTDTGKITSIQLTVGEANVPAIDSTRMYDGTTAANVTNPTVAVNGVLTGQTVTATATASYNDKNVGENKPLTIAYSLSGDAAKNYLPPVADTSKTASITARTLGYTNSMLETIKKADETSSAKIVASINPNQNTENSTLGPISGDEIKLTCTADYYTDTSYTQTTSATGEHPIKVTGTLTGADAGNYVMETKTATGKIVAANGVITTTYANGSWSSWSDTEKTLTPPNHDTGFKLFYKDSTTFYGLGSDGKIYQSNDMNNWSQYTNSDYVSADDNLSSIAYQIIGIDDLGCPLAIATNEAIYCWSSASWTETNSHVVFNDQSINPTYYSDDSSEYLIYQDSHQNIYQSSFNFGGQTQINTYPQILPSSFTHSLLSYDGSTLIVYAY